MLSLLLLFASGFDTTASVGVSAENRTGERPLSVNGDQGIVAEFELTPALGLAFAFKRGQLAFNYSPRLFERIDFTGDSGADPNRVLLLHQFGVGYSHQLTKQLTLNVNGAGSYGDVDYAGINLIQGQGQQVVTDEGNFQAAGRVPEGIDTFSNQSYNGGFGLTWQALKNHAFSASANVGYNASIGALDTFPATTIAGGALGWAWAIHPNYSLAINLAGNQTWIDVAMIGISRFRSLSTDATLNLRINRLLTIGLGGGMLLAENADAAPAEGVASSSVTPLPLANGSLTFTPTSGRGNFNLSTTFGASLSGFVDPLQGNGFAPRLATIWSLRVNFYESWNFEPSVSFVTPTSLNPVCEDPATGVASLNETNVALRAPISYQISQAFAVSAGVSLSARGNNLACDDVQFVDRFLQGFVRFTANYATRL